jgi:hypothetical protein
VTRPQRTLPPTVAFAGAGLAFAAPFGLLPLLWVGGIVGGTHIHLAATEPKYLRSSQSRLSSHSIHR